MAGLSAQIITLHALRPAIGRPLRSKCGQRPHLLVIIILICTADLYTHTDYSEERLAVILNSDLADTLGNLLLRVTSRKVNPNGGRVHFSTKLFPLFGGRTEEARACDEDLALVNKLNELPGEFHFWPVVNIIGRLDMV